MKKNYLLFLCMMICAGVFFTSCGKDDEETSEWQDALGTYTAEGTSLLTLDEKPAAATKSATLSTGTGGSLKVTLTNIVPDNATVEIDNIAPADKTLYYEIAGQTTVGETTVAITGTLSAAAGTKLLDLKVSRKITSPPAGNWMLSHTETGAAVYADIKTSDPAGQALGAMLPPMLGGMISLKVNEVWVKLSEDGTFDVTWDPVEEGAATGMPEFVKQLVTIHYFVEDDKVYLALDKSLLDLLALLPTEGTGINLATLITAITSIGEERGDFIVLPINVKQDDSNHATFYVGKDKLGVILPLMLPMLQGVIPEGVVPPGTLEQLPGVIASAETFDIGLSFDKQ